MVFPIHLVANQPVIVCLAHDFRLQLREETPLTIFTP